MLKTIHKLAKKYNVRVYFYKRFNGLGGYYNTVTKTIHIWNGKQDLLSVFFHELGHHYCVKNGIWPAYHSGKVWRKKHLRAFMLTAFKAERWIDGWAKREMLKHSKKEYKGYYMLPESRKTFYKEFLQPLKASIR